MKMARPIFALFLSYLCVCCLWKCDHSLASGLKNDNEDILPDELVTEDDPKADNVMFTSSKRSDSILQSKFFVRVLLVGFNGDGQQEVSLSTNTLEENLQHSILTSKVEVGCEALSSTKELQESILQVTKIDKKSAQTVTLHRSSQTNAPLVCAARKSKARSEGPTPTGAERSGTFAFAQLRAESV